MSYNSIHKCLIDNKLWGVISVLLLGWYLSPLFHHTFYVPTFDNLDSNVVWYKILAESGKIFAPNNTIIPNMMGGLPRSSYSGEFNFLLWLYYFFKPQTAYIINEVLIHLIAFFSMFIFLKNEMIPPNKYYSNVPSFVGALYFALLPFWSGGGAGLAFLPLVTYALIRIKNGTSGKWEWIFLALLPLYSSFILIYFFYIIMAGIYLIYDSWYHRKINWKFFTTLVLMGSVFLLTKYRLLYAMFMDPLFISSRTEFNIFFKEDWWETYRLSLVNLLACQPPHATTLISYVLPLTLITLLLEFIHRRLTPKESLLIWLMIGVSFWVNIWQILLIHKFTIPAITLLALVSVVYQKKAKPLALLLLFIIFLSIFSNIFLSKHFLFLAEYFPVLKEFNMVRMVYIFPFIFGIMFALSIYRLFSKLHFTALATLVLMVSQFIYAQNESMYKTTPQKGYASFHDYYVPFIFTKLKKDISHGKNKHPRVVSYGMEPAVALYNGLYTVDGYSANYPLSYKKQFEKVFDTYKKDKLYKNWGSKVYIVSVPSEMKYYIKGLHIKKLQFNENALCNLGTEYLISPYFFDTPQTKHLTLIKNYTGTKHSWDIYLYKLHCKNTK